MTGWRKKRGVDFATSKASHQHRVLKCECGAILENCRCSGSKDVEIASPCIHASKASDDNSDDDGTDDDTQASSDDEEFRRRIDGHAKATDKLVAGYVPDLVEKLTDARTAVEESVLAAMPSSSALALASAELKALQSVIDLIDGTGYIDALYTTAQELVEVGWNGARDLLDIQTGFDIPPVWAMEHVEDAAKHVGSIVADNDKKTLTAVLEEAMLRGWSSADTADALHAAFSNGITSYDEDGNETRTTKSEAYWKMVARTEMQRAAVTGQIAMYKAALVKTVQWDASQACDQCEPYNEEIFEIDDPDLPEIPLHPNCRCSWIPADADLGGRIGTAEDQARVRATKESTEES